MVDDGDDDATAKVTEKMFSAKDEEDFFCIQRVVWKFFVSATYSGVIFNIF